MRISIRPNAVAGALAMHADADAAIEPRRALSGRSRREAAPVGDSERRIEHVREFAGIVDMAAGRAIRHGRRRDQIAPPQRDRVRAQLARRLIDQTLEQECRFRPPGAAIRADGGGIGEGAAHGNVDQRKIVDAGQRRRRVHCRRARRIREIGAEIRRQRHAHCHDGAVGGKRHLAVAHEIPPVHVRG